jgi:hypothetical protein
VSAPPNRYTVAEGSGRNGWRVVIRDPKGAQASVRACADEAEARLYASTVRQHIFWLSEEQFRAFYRLPEETEA